MTRPDDTIERSASPIFANVHVIAVNDDIINGFEDINVGSRDTTLRTGDPHAPNAHSIFSDGRIMSADSHTIRRSRRNSGRSAHSISRSPCTNSCSVNSSGRSHHHTERSPWHGGDCRQNSG